MSPAESRPKDGETARLDRWLWAARQYKTRSLASKAVTGGHVRLNGRRVKPAAPVRVGDRVRVRKGPYEFDLEVLGLSESRGQAKEAARLYAETAESKAAREVRRIQVRQAAPPAYTGKGRPTKRERRVLDKLRKDRTDR